MKRKILALMLVIVLVLGMFSGCSKAIDAQEARAGVVRVMAIYLCECYDYDAYVEDGEAKLLGNIELTSFGSAFGVGTAGEPTDVFVTNRHVVESTTGGTTYIDNEHVIFVGEIEAVYILKDDYAYTDTAGLDTSRASLCTVLYEADEDEADIAVLRCADTLEDRMALPLLDTDYELEVGDEVIALGYPGTSDDDDNAIDTLASVDHVTVTEGKISVFRPMTDGDATVDTIQHSATINHGNSGGPLITPTGEVAGINTYSQSGSSGDTSTNNSIEIKYVMKVLDSLDIDYDVRKPSSGVGLIVGIAAAAAVIAAAVVVLLRKRKPEEQEEQPTAPVSPVNPTPVIPDDSGLRIQCISGAFAGKRFAIGRQLRIGRNPQNNDLVYPSDTPGVSGTHCLLIYQDGQLYLQDLGSTYGTFLGSGQRLAANQAALLHIGDRFCLGSQNETFVVTGRGGI